MRDRDAAVQVQHAFQLRMEGKFHEALQALQPVLVLESPPASALLIAAECLQVTADEIDLAAVEDFLRRAVGLAPESPDPMLELAHFLYTWRDKPSSDVFELLAKARKAIDRAEVSAMLLESHLLRDENRLRDAISLLEKAVERFPTVQTLKDALDSARGASGYQG